MVTIQRLDLHAFKAFERFTLYVSGDAYLAGPNNAGKSTLTAALRTTARMVRIAHRRGPNETFDDRSEEVLGYSFLNSQVELAAENLPHEFRQDDVRMVVRFSQGATLTAVWPGGSDESAFFYLQQNRSSINNVRQARDAFPDVGVVPVLSPVEVDEEELTTKYVRDNLDGRLASRHFRNQLLLLNEERHGDDLDAFRNFVERWLPEMNLKSLTSHLGQRGTVLDLYYTDAGRRTEKEIAWAGDGMQIWLQLLLHVFRFRNRDVVVLDEPDVFLHPDLQRRLVQLLEELPGQTITATHSPEVLAESDSRNVVWVDKSRKQSVAGTNTSDSAALSRALGSQFGIRLARALRCRCVLFVEGEDLRILRVLARKVGLNRVADEQGVAVLPLRGFENWEHVEPFSWMVGEFLQGAVAVFVLLDRDFRSEEACCRVQSRLSAATVRSHIWRRKELESYLLDARVVKRLTGANIDWTEEALAQAAEESEDDVFGQVCAEVSKEFRRDQTSHAAKEAKRRFDTLWSKRDSRKWLAPPDRVLHGLNRRLAASERRTVSYRDLARAFEPDEVPGELAGFLERVEEASRN